MMADDIFRDREMRATEGWRPLNVLPNVARAWDWNADKSQLTVHLREGIRWSDGEQCRRMQPLVVT